MVNVLKLFENINVDSSWSFSDKTIKDTTYATHGYHRYPAKFIPQITSRLIQKYSTERQLVCDPFCGSGTTLVEATLNTRNSYGIDVNPVATLITRAKITPIIPSKIDWYISYFEQVLLDKNANYKNVELPFSHSRIDHWFHLPEKNQLAFILDEIDKIVYAMDINVKIFLQCAFSHILKNCSIWNQKSNKPVRDFNKTPANPITAFLQQLRKMASKNKEFVDLLTQAQDREYIKSDVRTGDARDISILPNNIDLVITSPPYVTSYEYADLHQLTALWFQYTSNIVDFRRNFIGTLCPQTFDVDTNSHIAQNIIEMLRKKSPPTANNVARYFSHMNYVLQNIYQKLQIGGKICIVIGNTTLKDVPILNAEVFTQQMLNIGFHVENIIKREILSKTLPSTRDKTTGKFIKANGANQMLVYPTEYIIIMNKKF